MVSLLISAAFWCAALITRRCLLRVGACSDLTVNDVALIRGRRLFEVRHLLEEIRYMIAKKWIKFCPYFFYQGKYIVRVTERFRDGFFTNETENFAVNNSLLQWLKLSWIKCSMRSTLGIGRKLLIEKTIPRRCYCKKVFWKYAANAHENNHAEVWI